MKHGVKQGKTKQTKRFRFRTARAAGIVAGVLVGVLAALLVFGSVAKADNRARAGDPELLTFGAGAFDISDNDGAGMLSLEYVDDRRWIWHLRPMTGFFATFDGGLYGYAGVSLDLYFGRNLVVTPSFAPGLYLKSGGKDLGSPIEFRSSIKVAWRFPDRSRLGLDFNHLSNAGIDDVNPGANQLMLFYSIPFARDGR